MYSEPTYSYEHVERDLLEPALERIYRNGKIWFQQDLPIILRIQYKLIINNWPVNLTPLSTTNIGNVTSDERRILKLK
jgi:hypothetical protein